MGRGLDIWDAISVGLFTVQGTCFVCVILFRDRLRRGVAWGLFAVFVVAGLMLVAAVGSQTDQ